MPLLRAGEQLFEVSLERREGDSFTATLGGQPQDVRLRLLEPGILLLERGGVLRRFAVARRPGGGTLVGRGGASFAFTPEEGRRRGREQAGSLSSPMPGKLIRILKSEGEAVKKGEILVVVEAMKMELPIRASRDGVVKKLSGQLGERVAPGVALVELD